MEVVDEVGKTIKFILTAGSFPCNAINVMFIEVGLGSRILLENLFFEVADEQTGVVRP